MVRPVRLRRHTRAAPARKTANVVSANMVSAALTARHYEVLHRGIIEGWTQGPKRNMDSVECSAFVVERC